MTDISKRAQKTLELIKNGKFYMAYDENLPATIQELLDAKLIVGTVRATTYVASFAPADGYIPMRMEHFARGQCGDGEGYAMALVEIAAPKMLAALKSLIGDTDEGMKYSARITQARAAIAEAEGRAP